MLLPYSTPKLGFHSCCPFVVAYMTYLQIQLIPNLL
jgi:iron only hydrogenase large subunit-like protein